MLESNAQVRELAMKAKEILLVFRRDGVGDAVSSSLALASVLEKLGKRVTIASAHFRPPAKLSFLPGIARIVASLPLRRKFLISLDVSKTAVDELSYDMKGSDLVITILPREGNFSPQDITTKSEGPPFDLIVTLDTPDLASLGALFEEEPDFFYATPLVNIDHHPENEHYGQVNLVDLVASSTAEIIALHLPTFGEDLLDPDVATLLLAGMIAETKSFQERSTPRTLSLAAQLIEKGARREEIIRHFYQTKSLGSLRLWGRALARIKVASESNLAWSLLTQDDFVKSGGSMDDLPEVIGDLIFSSPEAKVGFLLFDQGDGKVGGMIETTPGFDALTLAKPFRPEGTKSFARFSLAGKTLPEAEKEVVEAVQSRIAKSRTS